MNYCGECTYLKPNDPDLYGRYWCEKRLERVLANNEACYRFCTAYSRSKIDIEKYEKYYYSIEHNDVIYKITFTINSDYNGTCAYSHESVINSLDFK